MSRIAISPVLGYENSILQDEGGIPNGGRADALTAGLTAGWTIEVDSKIKHIFNKLTPSVDATKQFVYGSVATEETLLGKMIYAWSVQTPKNIAEWVKGDD